MKRNKKRGACNGKVNKSVKKGQLKKTFDVEYISKGYKIMPKNYRHIKPYENEIIEIKRQELTQRQIKRDRE